MEVIYKVIGLDKIEQGFISKAIKFWKLDESEFAKEVRKKAKNKISNLNLEIYIEVLYVLTLKHYEVKDSTWDEYITTVLSGYYSYKNLELPLAKKFKKYKKPQSTKSE
jgi:hypothetical protein